MSTEAAAHSGHFENYKGFTSGKFAMWLFLASDAMGFMGLIGAYMVLRISSDNWMVNDLDPPFGIDLTAFMTFLLIVSSVTMVKAFAESGFLSPCDQHLLMIAAVFRDHNRAEGGASSV